MTQNEAVKEKQKRNETNSKQYQNGRPQSNYTNNYIKCQWIKLSNKTAVCLNVHKSKTQPYAVYKRHTLDLKALKKKRLKAVGWKRYTKQTINKIELGWVINIR